MTTTPTLVTMTEVMISKGVERPNCAGLNPEFFIPELRTGTFSYARDICSRCESRPECPVWLGKLTLSKALDGAASI